MSGASRWLVFALGVVTVLAAAKAHGRQLRLERELAGYWRVTFGARNPDWVEALWRRDRLYFWSMAATLTVITIAVRVLAPRFGWTLPLAGSSGERSWLGGIFLHVLVPMTGAFVVTAAVGLERFVVALRGTTPTPAREWLNGAVWGTAGWWALTLTLMALVSFLAWRRAS